MDGSMALVLPYRTYVGFDNIPLASYITLGLETIHLPAYQMGTLGVEALLDRIKNGSKPPVHRLLELELIVRGSLRTREGSVNQLR